MNSVRGHRRLSREQVERLARIRDRLRERWDWLLVSEGEDLMTWLDRIEETRNAIRWHVLCPARYTRMFVTKLSWMKAFVLAQAWARREEPGVWERAMKMFDRGTRERKTLENNRRSDALTVLAFPGAAATILGLSLGEVWKAVGGRGEPPLFLCDLEMVWGHGFGYFLRNRSRPEVACRAIGGEDGEWGTL